MTLLGRCEADLARVILDPSLFKTVSGGPGHQARLPLLPVRQLSDIGSLKLSIMDTSELPFIDGVSASLTTAGETE